MKKVLRYSLILCLLLGEKAYAQDRVVSGRVTAADDKLPIPGVTVKAVGASAATQTNADGLFTLSIPEGVTQLQFSFLGYATRMLPIAAGTMNVVLKQDSKQLGEVVITSFGIQRDKKSLGYGTSTISSDELTTAKVTNITNGLSAKIPGVRVSGSGGAFTGSSVIIRGFTTFTGSNQPLYVLDGIPIDNSGGNTPLQSGPSRSNRAIDINAEDIENITVLKGAAATALYGSRAASGVILITSKKGGGVGSKKTAITYSNSYNVGEVNRLPEYQNTYSQGSLGVYNPSLGTSWGAIMKGQMVNNWFSKPAGAPFATYHPTTEALIAYPNNVKDIFKQSYNLQNNLSFTGGTDKSSYRVTYGNATETYVLDNNKLKRNTISVNANTQVTPKLLVGTAFTYTNSNSIRTQQGNQLSNPLFRAYFTPRSYDLTNIPFETADGNQIWFNSEDHPYWSIKYNKYDDEVNRLIGSVNLKYDFTDWLTANLKVGTDYFTSKSSAFDEIGNRGGGNAGASSRLVGGIRESGSSTRNVNSYFTLTGTRKYGDFTLTGTLGNEILQNAFNFNTVDGYELIVPGFRNLTNAVVYQPSHGSSKTRLAGVFGDFIVDYKNYLTLNVKARNDWSSTLSKQNRSIFYPAVATSFVVTEAFPTLKESGAINLIKLRANWGEVGKGAPVYSTNTYFTTAASADGFGPEISFPFNGLVGFSYSDLAGQPDITPEFTQETELGGEFAFFGNRLTLDASYYERKTRDVILSVPVSAASGFTNVLKNAGNLNTKGFELVLGATPLKSANASYSFSLNFTKFKSVVTSLAPGVDNIFLGGFTTPNIRLVAGDEYGQIYGSAYQRDANGNLLVGANGLPLATPDVKKIGNPNPDWTMGINNEIVYKSLQLSVLLDIRKGGDQYSRNIADVQRNGVAIETAALDRFQADGVTLATPYTFSGVFANGIPANVMLTAQQYWGNSGKYVAAEGFIYDTSWFRVREASLTYAFPQKLLDRTPFGKLEIGLFGRNLYLKAPNYPHFDPEQNALGISNAQGLEFNSLPNTRTFGANLRVTF
ncbi:MAG: SusC/RagA family TonB-linked outer membrane protein [Sphingobacteriales bacterium]|nr:SusC/RagA family TonB-linked outer membrane protein [Sphingobacteriales bacterium]